MPLLNTHPRVTTIWEIGNSLLTKDQGISMKPPTPGRTNQTLIGNELKHSRAHEMAQSLPIRLESEAEDGETTIDITPEHGHNVTKEAKDEVKEVMEEDESEVETDWEVKEILKDEEEDEDGEYVNSFPTMEELTYHEWLLKKP
ncbi:hypothetical protein Tco_0000909 [Tanacetum coccineum]